MSSTQMKNEQATRIPSVGMVDMKLDVVVHPVSDVDAKRDAGTNIARLSRSRRDPGADCSAGLV